MLLSFVTIRVKVKGPMPRELRRRMPGITKSALITMARFWHRTMRPKHFTKAGARLYKYQPRAGEQEGVGSKAFRRSHTGRKLRQFGHTDPLVWTGASRRATAFRNIRGTSKGSRVIMRAPTLNFRVKGQVRSMRDELTTISRAEVRTLIKNLRRKVNRKIGEIRTTRTIRA